MDRSITAGRLVVAVVTTSAEEAAIYAIWRWLLPEAGVRLPVEVPAAVMAVWLGFCVWLFFFTTRALKLRPAGGMISMVGMTGRAAGPLLPDGMVNISGELWKATSMDGKIKSGEEVVVTGEEGLKLKVRRARPGETTR
jgi:membrane-bound ClpP family serine protease